nr:MAG TPA: hypothetical protein [Caudoviricetes sp.]
MRLCIISSRIFFHLLHSKGISLGWLTPLKIYLYIFAFVSV